MTWSQARTVPPGSFRRGRMEQEAAENRTFPAQFYWEKSPQESAGGAAALLIPVILLRAWNRLKKERNPGCCSNTRKAFLPGRESPGPVSKPLPPARSRSGTGHPGPWPQHGMCLSMS